MSKPALLLDRLAAIGASLCSRSGSLALIGLGSVGVERERLDDYSDLDFFVIVAPGEKQAFLNDLSWLTMVRPVIFQFQNTVDGYKLLFDDDVYCEFAVFEVAELANIPFAAGRVVWQREPIDALTPDPARSANAKPVVRSEWLLGEALTNLYVGLQRYQRGEKLSASYLIQQFAVARVVELTSLIECERNAPADPFAPERRFEQRFPDTAALLPQFLQGYDRSPESALALLAFLERHFEVNQEFAGRIRALGAAA